MTTTPSTTMAAPHLALFSLVLSARGRLLTAISPPMPLWLFSVRKWRTSLLSATPSPLGSRSALPPRPSRSPTSPGTISYHRPMTPFWWSTPPCSTTPQEYSRSPTGSCKTSRTKPSSSSPTSPPSSKTQQYSQTQQPPTSPSQSAPPPPKPS